MCEHDTNRRIFTFVLCTCLLLTYHHCAGIWLFVWWQMLTSWEMCTQRVTIPVCSLHLFIWRLSLQETYGCAALHPLDLGRFLSFLIYTEYDPLDGDQPVTRPLRTHRITKTQNKRTQTSMSWVGFKPTIPVLQRAKTVHALDCSATEIGFFEPYWKCFLFQHPLFLQYWLVYIPDA
jgi:hypothetical protein